VADGAVLKGWFFEPESPTGDCAIILHGIGDTRVGAIGFARMFLGHGYAVLTPDSRGHAESGGDIVTYGVLEADDVLRWVDWMHGQGCREVVGLGESLGASILLQAAGRKPAFRALIGEGAYSSFPAIAVERVGRLSGLSPALARLAVWPSVAAGLVWARLRYGIDLWSVDPAESARQSGIPILLIHGVRDNLTSPDNSRAIAAAAAKAELWLVPNTGHVGASAVDPVAFESRVFDFLARIRR
jgi:fermentation-respiration switch protein FrsA (DUF1100 family)